MSLVASRDPRWVDAILDWRGTWPLTRAALTSAYWIGGLTKLFDRHGALAEVARFGLHPGRPIAALTIAVELGCSGLLIAGRAVWLSSGALGVFTAFATLVGGEFWRLQGHARVTAANIFFEHVGLIAGLILAALVAEHLQRDPQGSPHRGWR